MIYHLVYRIGKERKQHVYAIKSICERRRKQLQALHGENVTIWKETIA